MNRDELIRLAEATPHQCRRASMLFIVGDDQALGSGAFDQLSWRMVHLRTCTEVRGRLERTIPRVILCDSDLPDGNWKDVLEMAASLHDPPPVIVTSRLADEYLWAEVLNLGGYDVLSKPLDARELERTLRLAWERRPDPQDLQTRATGTRIQNGDSKICSTA